MKKRPFTSSHLPTCWSIHPARAEQSKEQRRSRSPVAVLPNPCLPPHDGDGGSQARLAGCAPVFAEARAQQLAGCFTSLLTLSLHGFSLPSQASRALARRAWCTDTCTTPLARRFRCAPLGTRTRSATTTVPRSAAVQLRVLTRLAHALLQTIGASFAMKKVEAGGRPCNLGIWDTAGQERFDSLSSFYCRGARAAIICFDLTDKVCVV